jgi:hypothetical protein
LPQLPCQPARHPHLALVVASGTSGDGEPLIKLSALRSTEGGYIGRWRVPSKLVESLPVAQRHCSYSIRSPPMPGFICSSWLQDLPVCEPRPDRLMPCVQVGPIVLRNL